jgi:DNA-binding transcriptional LysR family regulator
VNIRQLAHFIAVLENSSILKASVQLNISQPAMSKSITTLESQYGVALFKRLARGVEPTTFAFALEKYARRMLMDFEQSKDEMSSLAAGASGRISAGIGPPFAAVGHATITEFRELYPLVDFTIITEHANHLRAALLNNQIDFFLGMYNTTGYDDLASCCTIEHVLSDRFIGICPRGHPLEGRDVPVEDLSRYEWIVPELEEAGRVALENYFLANQCGKPRFSIITNSEVILQKFLTEHGMLTIMAEGNAQATLFAQCGRFRLRGYDFERKVGIIRRANVLSTPLQDRFVAMLKSKVLAAREATYSDMHTVGVLDLPVS